jgi:glucan phosphorylase
MKFACKWRQLFLLCTLTARIAMAAFSLSSLTDIASSGFGLMTQSIDWAATKIGYEACPYVEDPFPAITNGITKYIWGQDCAVTLI